MSEIKLIKATELPSAQVMQFRHAFLSAGEHSINGSRGLHNYDKYEDWLWLVTECEKPDNTLIGVQTSTWFAVRKSDEKVLLTCDTDNVASCKTIKKCGGMLERKEAFYYKDEPYFKYWIEI